MQLRLIFLFVAFAVCTLHHDILMAQKSWDGGGDGTSWNDPANWNPNGVPTATDDVDLSSAPNSLVLPANVVANSIGTNSGSTGTTTISGRRLTVSGASSLEGRGLTFSGNGTELDMQSFTLHVGNTGSGKFRLENQAKAFGVDGQIAFDTGSSGIATVSGSGSRWDLANILAVGRAGNGTLNIESGGVVNNHRALIGSLSGGIGTANIDGFGSSWNVSGEMILGGTETADGGQGTITISNGGRLNVGDDNSFGKVSVSGSGAGGLLVIRNGSILNSNTDSFSSTVGGGTGKSGTVSVLGAGSQWNSQGILLLGSSGNGFLNIDSGGVVTNMGRVILADGSSSSGDITVTGSGSQLSSTDTMDIGFAGVGVVNVGAGGSLTNTVGFLGSTANAFGTATVSGTGSQWNNSGALNVGLNGNGTLIVEDGGLTSNTTGVIGSEVGSTGTVTINGTGSQWNNSGFLYVGLLGNGTLNVEAGGLASSSRGEIGFDSNSTGSVTITGNGSQWNNSGELTVGVFGTGTLDVEAGGVISSFGGSVAFWGGSTGTATITGNGSQWNNLDVLSVGASGNGTLNIEAGGKVSSTDSLLGDSVGGTGTAIVTGDGSLWSTGNLFLGGSAFSDGGVGTLNILDGGQLLVGDDTVNGVMTIGGSGAGAELWVRNGSRIIAGPTHVWLDGSFIGNSSGTTGTVTITGTGSQWINPNLLYIGSGGSGMLNVEAGGLVTNTTGIIGNQTGSFGAAIVTGAGSQWNTAVSLLVGYRGNGTLNVEAGSLVNSEYGFIGSQATSTGTVIITGSGSHWNNSAELHVGESGTGTLNVEAGGLVTSPSGVLGAFSGASGTATITGTGSMWDNANLYIGGTGSAAGGTATLNINNDGRVKVGGQTKIWSTGTVNLNGGRFEFGETTLPEFASINAVSGSMAGNVTHTDYTDVATLTPFQNSNVDLSEVSATNSGTLYGDASLNISLNNLSTGVVETMAGERMRFLGLNNSNAGEINNFGGQIRFESILINEASGFIAGRGQFTAIDGWTNEGVMAFSGGFADVLGDFENDTGGQVVTSGLGVTTFFDDVIHNGTEMRTAEGSGTVFLGDFTGAGSFTGTGDVFFEGDLRPGNSPDIVSFEGDVFLGTGAMSFIELGGLDLGEFDRFEIAGDFSLNGALDVSLIDGFALGFSQEFLIADITGTRDGFFDGLSEGDLVGNFGGQDLFISYSAGDGNDISLFTAVPEPGSATIIGVFLLGALLRRKKR